MPTSRDTEPLWASGPAELLRHGLRLLRDDSDSNRRLAMISIDNAVELMIKTYLGLPRRITGLSIPRRDFTTFSESFPGLLDALETHAADKIVGIDLGEIEWFHRLRNQLYHQGNGLTVERDKVAVYAELANVLFQNLFGLRLSPLPPGRAGSVGEFLEAWVEFERLVVSLAGPKPKPLVDLPRWLYERGHVTDAERDELADLRRIRNLVVHGQADSDSLNPQLPERVRALTHAIRSRTPELGP